MIEICAHCVFELDGVNAAIRGQYQDYDESWKEIPYGKVIDIVVAEGRPVKSGYGTVLHPERSLVLFQGGLLCPDHFRGQFAAALKKGIVA